MNFQGLVIPRKRNEQVELVDYAEPLVEKCLRESAKALVENFHAADPHTVGEGKMRSERLNKRQLEDRRRAEIGHIVSGPFDECSGIDCV
jgi:hypothetical protein